MFKMFSIFYRIVMLNKLNRTFPILVPQELKIIRKEHFNRWYKLRSFYAAFLAADLPMQVNKIIFVFICRQSMWHFKAYLYFLQVLLAVSFTASGYVSTSQPLEFSRFFMVLLIHSLIGMVASGIGIMLGSLVNPVVSNILNLEPTT